MISRRQAKRAMELYGDSLSAYPNVVGIGTRPVDREDHPASERDHSLAVYVTAKRPIAELEPDDRLPRYVEIPGRGTTHRVAVQVIEVGRLGVQDAEYRESGRPGASTFGAE